MFRTESKTNENVLITGINGFTGRFLAEKLRKKGYCVFGLMRSDGDDSKKIDIRDKNSVCECIKELRPKYVFHLAAQSREGGDYKDYYDVNIVGTANLLSGLEQVKGGVKKVFLMSTSKVYAEATDGRLLTEDSPIQPCSHYAISKMAMEMLRYSFDLPIKIVRAFNFTGAGQSSFYLIPKIVESCVLKIKIFNI